MATLSISPAKPCAEPLPDEALAGVVRDILRLRHSGASEEQIKTDMQRGSVI